MYALLVSICISTVHDMGAMACRLGTLINQGSCGQVYETLYSCFFLLCNNVHVVSICPEDGLLLDTLCFDEAQQHVFDVMDKRYCCVRLHVYLLVRKCMCQLFVYVCVCMCVCVCVYTCVCVLGVLSGLLFV